MVKYDDWFLEKARELDKLEKEYLKYEYETQIPNDKEGIHEHLREIYNISREAFDIRNEILVEYHHFANLQINDNRAKLILKKVKEKNSFYSVTFFENFIENLNELAREKGLTLNQSSFSDYLEYEIIDELRDSFHSYYDFLSYFKSKISIGPIISSSRVPDIAQRYFTEIRESYALDLYLPCVALCRALFEMCLFDKLLKKRLVEIKNTKVRDIFGRDNYTLSQLIAIAKNKQVLNSEMEKISRDIKEGADKILHVKEINKDAKGFHKNTYDIICDTIKVIEYLYK